MIEVIDANGNRKVKSADIDLSGGLIGIQRITATGAGTYTPTAGTNWILVELQGAGGGGGGVANPGGSNAQMAGGGSGGAWLRVRLNTNFSGASYSVGAKGTGGAAGANAGNSGGNTTFTDTAGSPTTYTAAGGSGGAGGGSFAAFPNIGPTTAGGAPTNGDDSMTGGSTRPAIATSLNAVHGGSGGASKYSQGAASVRAQNGSTSTAGISADGKGGGGSGAAISGNVAAKAGGDGSDGLIIIWEFS